MAFDKRIVVDRVGRAVFTSVGHKKTERTMPNIHDTGYQTSTFTIVVFFSWPTNRCRVPSWHTHRGKQMNVGFTVQGFGVSSSASVDFADKSQVTMLGAR